jgi:EmrB/QacA subfamily drug resistance transporter
LLSALVLVGGAAGDRFGQREAFAAGILAFSLASIGCALSASPAALIAWRAMQGIGASFMVPGSLALIARTFAPDRRGWAIGLWSMVSGIAAALGPILGGILLERGGDPAWRWIFWINPPLGLVTLCLLYGRTRRHQPGRAAGIDITGALLVTLGLGSLAYALTKAGEADASAAQPILAAALGVVAVGGFVWWESRAREPMLPLSLFRSRTVTGTNLLTFVLYFALSGSLFFLPMTLIEALRLPEAKAGSVFLPFTVTMALVAQYSGGLADRRGARLPIALGSLVVALSFAAVALAVGMAVRAGSDAYWWGVLPAMALLGLGMGFVVAPLSTAVMTAVDESLAGAASGVNNGVARMASLFAVAGLGIVAAHTYSLFVDPGLVPGSYGEPAASLGEAARAMRSQAMVAAFVAVSIATALLSLASAGVAWAMLPSRQQGEAGIGERQPT